MVTFLARPRASTSSVPSWVSCPTPYGAGVDSRSGLRRHGEVPPGFRLPVHRFNMPDDPQALVVDEVDQAPACIQHVGRHVLELERHAWLRRVRQVEEPYGP